MFSKMKILAMVVIALSPLPKEGESAGVASGRARRPGEDSTSRGYETRRIEGWTILINTELAERQPELADRALKELTNQLYRVTRVVPLPALQKLKTIKIWVEEHEAEPPCMTYHPDPNWLREHGKDPSKARCIELSNVRTFVEWTIQQPWMVLHELSHAYHHQFLDGGFDNRDILAAYDHAKEAKLYDLVLRNNGRMDRGYASTNHKEYFAEISEAYFGTNDFFPFVGAELKDHDSRGFELLGKLWGVRQGGGPPISRRAPGKTRRTPDA